MSKQQCSRGNKCLKGYIKLSFLSFYKDFGDGIQSVEGVMLKG